ncbi:hypothetical protein [Thermococcus atlanticus]
MEKVRERVRVLEETLSKNPEELSEELNKAVSRTGMGHDLDNYLKVLKYTKSGDPTHLNEIMDDDNFLEQLYRTLESWDMNKRRARMKTKEQFKQAVREVRHNFIDLAYRLQESSNKDIREFQALEGSVRTIFNKLHVMKTRSKLVANSKLMHFILPTFFMPIDRGNTIKFLELPDPWLEIEWEAFRNIHILISEFTRNHYVELEKIVEIDKKRRKSWNQTIPKVIDNLIIYCIKTQDCRK